MKYCSEPPWEPCPVTTPVEWANTAVPFGKRKILMVRKLWHAQLTQVFPSLALLRCLRTVSKIVFQRQHNNSTGEYWSPARSSVNRAYRICHFCPCVCWTEYLNRWWDWPPPAEQLLHWWTEIISYCERRMSALDAGGWRWHWLPPDKLHYPTI